MAVQTTTTAPWAAQQPYLTYGFGQAKDLYKQGGPKYFPGSTVAPLSGSTNTALGMYEQQARQGSAVAGSANEQVNATLQGDYLNSNPYLDAMYNNAAGAVTRNYQESVAPSIAANFGLSGRSGQNAAFSNAMDSSRDTLSRNLGGMAANIYGGSYEAERGRQMQAAQLAPGAAALNYFDASQMLNAGNVRDQYAQNKTNDQFNRYMFNQERPWDNLGRYQQMINGSYGSQNTQPIYKSSLGQNIGTGMALAGGGMELYDYYKSLFP